MKKTIPFFLIILSCSIYAQTYTNALEIPPLLNGPNFSLTIKESEKEFIQGQTTQTYSYNEMNYLGPTLVFNKGEVVNFDITNTTPEEATVHWHGFRVPAIWDGGPQNPIDPDEVWSPTFEIKENASTMWYHSHIHGETARQVSKGMAGLIIIKDNAEALVDLPRTYAEDDFPLIIQDKIFNNNGEIQPAPLGSVMMVNGTVTPYLETPAQVVRFRMLNASNERAYNLGFTDNRNFYQIGTDGGLLEAPVELNRVIIAPGERAEILVDLTGEAVSNSLILKSYATEFPDGVAGSFTQGPGGGNGPLDGVDFEIMEFRVIAQTSNAVTSVPSTLVSIDFVSTDEIDRTRTKTLMNPSGPGEPFTIDGVLFDHNVVNDTVNLGAKEMWRFVNTSSLAHPMHIHDIQFNIISRNGSEPPANEKGWKDVVFVYPNETVEVLGKFEDYADSTYAYMYHCHLLGHEDRGMMHRFLVVDPSWYETTSVQQINKTNGNSVVSYYPNPVKGLVNFNLNRTTYETVIKVYNILGELIEQKTFYNRQVPSMNLSNLASGFYVISLDIDGQNKVLKMIKK